MAKKTGFFKVLGRRDFIVKEALNRLKEPPYKEVVTYLDFTQGRQPRYLG